MRADVDRKRQKTSLSRANLAHSVRELEDVGEENLTGCENCQYLSVKHCDGQVS
jgi:hypothetical protein